MQNQTTENLIRKDLQRFSAYSSARSLKVDGDIWLNANESPYNDENLFNRYPLQQPQELVQRLAGIYKVKTDNLLITRGSDEGIDLLFRLYCEYQKDSVFAVEPTFGMYKIAAQLQGVKYNTIKLEQEDNLKLNITKLLENIPNNCKLVFLCTPNNPTGKSLSLADIEKVLANLAGKCIVVVDEAYIEFSSEQSATTLIDKYQNLVVLRTLSKSFGMAGLRLGTIISNANMIEWLRKILAPYPIPKTTETTILSLLDNKSLAKLDSQVEEIKQQRQIILEKLEQLAIVNKVYSSDANFLLVRFNKEVFDDLIVNNIVVRSMAHFFNHEKILRISIGTSVENKKLIEILQKLSSDYEEK
ncbi:histidinol-phosphate transaminase [Francisella halioticida]|uniref:Histidinol-phosphate aminotransferase n=1 Tax=Francisella halioticida TaxID=549298 RepID=A0ABN5AUR7_9GAMM|nr:histidinol-phosphate transaminase [Francisella halioticida]ASG67681.1 histidinol-phosphate transaminase [Francisella halioticida]